MNMKMRKETVLGKERPLDILKHVAEPPRADEVSHERSRMREERDHYQQKLDELVGKERSGVLQFVVSSSSLRNTIYERSRRRHYKDAA